MTIVAPNPAPAPDLSVRVCRHDGREFAFGRKGQRAVLLLPTQAAAQQAIDRFRDQLSVDELRALYGVCG